MSNEDLFDYDDSTDIGLDDDSRSKATDTQEWFKMAKGQIARISFVYFHPIDRNEVVRVNAKLKEQGKGPLTEDQKKAIVAKALEKRAKDLETTVDKLSLVDRLDTTEVKFRMFKAHYQPGMGYIHSLLGKEGAEADLVWKRLEEPKTYFTSLLLVYAANARGEVDPAKLEWRFVPWRFAKPVYMDIWKQNAGLQNNNLSIASQDLKAECTDTGFQKIGVSTAGPAVWQRNPRVKRKVLEQALALYDKLDPFRHMTTAQLRSKLLGTGESVPSDTSSMSSVSTADYTDVLAEIESA